MLVSSPRREYVSNSIYLNNSGPEQKTGPAPALAPGPPTRTIIFLSAATVPTTCVGSRRLVPVYVSPIDFLPTHGATALNSALKSTGLYLTTLPLTGYMWFPHLNIDVEAERNNWTRCSLLKEPGIAHTFSFSCRRISLAD